MAFRPLQQQEEQIKVPVEQEIPSPSSFRPLTQTQRVNTALKIEQPRGIMGEILPAAFSVGGGIIGGILGAPVAGIGAVPGAVAGATAGGALGETIQQAIEKNFLGREKFDVGQIGVTGALGGATEGAGQAAFAVGKLALKPLVELSKPAIIKAISVTSGFADNLVQEALKRGKGAVEAIGKGEDALTEMVQRSAKGVSDYAKRLLQQSKTAIRGFDDAAREGQPISAQADELLSDIHTKLEGANIGLESPTAKVLREQGIGEEQIKQITQKVKEKPILEFNRPVKPSNIVSTSEQEAIRQSYSSLESISQNPSVEHIDAILEKLLVLRSKTPNGSPTGPETKAIIGEMIDSLQDFVKSAGTTNKAYADYAKFLSGNLRQRVLANEMKELFGSTANPSPKEATTIATRLLQMFNQGKQAIREATTEMGKKIGEDITGTVAGTLIKAGDDISIRAKNLTRRGVVEKLVESVPRAMLKQYIEKGNFNALEQSAVIKKLAQTVGLTAKTLIQEIVQVYQDKGTGKVTEF